MRILNGNLIEPLVFAKGYFAHPTPCIGERERMHGVVKVSGSETSHSVC